MSKILLLIACAFLSTNLLADGQAIDVTDGWVRETPPNARNAAAFLTLNNHSNTARQLTDVQCQTTLAARCELHEHLHTANGMRMQKATTAPTIPAAGSLQLAPGGYHIMLLDLTKPLLRGETVELIFIFDDQSSYKAQLPVKPVSQE
jgi:copper(I)-binding protein